MAVHERETIDVDGPDGIDSLFAKRGLRVTAPRRLIARVLFQSEDHPDAEELYDRVKKIDSSISIATVYRTMKLFEEVNIVVKRDFGDGRARYEPQTGPEDHHHHMIDIETGEVLEFYHQGLEDLKKQIAKELGFELVDHHLELFGVRIKPKN